MPGVSAKVGVGLLLMVGASALSAGCAENESTLFILGAAKLESSCTYTASSSTTMLPRGQYDVGFNGSYQVGLILGNQMAARGQKARSRTETSRIVLEGAEVTLLRPDGSLFREAFSAPGAGFVDVSAGQDAGYGVLSVVVIPRPEDAAEKRDALESVYLIAEIKAFGHTLGGQAVESNVFRFPIEVCLGCLVTFPPTELSAQGECLLSGGGEAATMPCLWGQDTQVVCSACAANYAVCREPGLSVDQL